MATPAGCAPPSTSKREQCLWENKLLLEDLYSRRGLFLARAVLEWQPLRQHLEDKHTPNADLETRHEPLAYSVFFPFSGFRFYGG